MAKKKENIAFVAKRRPIINSLVSNISTKIGKNGINIENPRISIKIAIHKGIKLGYLILSDFSKDL